MPVTEVRQLLVVARVSTPADATRAADALRAKHVNVHIRASRGRDIAAACGQLRHEARV